MKVIARPRGGGKTHEAILLSAERGAYIVCHSTSECDRIAESARKMGQHIPFPLTAHEFLHHSDGRVFNRQPVIIDNIELFIQNITKMPVGAITVTYAGDSK